MVLKFIKTYGKPFAFIRWNSTAINSMSNKIEYFFKNLDGILSFTYRSNPPPNFFHLYLKIMKLAVLNCAFGKVEFNFDSNIKKHNYLFRFISYRIYVQMYSDKFL